MEILGCGLIRKEILLNTINSNDIGYAFGIGLDR
jgi:phenylalanyl-tRNA synthetase alpha subunit